MNLETGNKEQTRSSSIALKAGTWYVISSIFVKAIAILTTPIFTRVMTQEQYGIAATFISWCALLLPLCTVNLTYSIGRAKLDFPERLDKYIGAMQLLSCAVTMPFCVICMVFIMPLSNLLKLEPTLIVFLLVYLLFTPAINFMQNGYRYRYQFKQNIAIAWYTGVSTVVLSLFLMFMTNWDRAVLRIIGIVIPNCLLSLYFWVRSLCQGNLHVNLEYWQYGLRLSVPLVLHTISLNVLSQSDRVFIQAIHGEKATAIYSLAYNYGLALSVVTNAIADGWLPWFHDNYFNGRFEIIRRNTKKVVMLGCYVGLACIALAPEALYILGGKGYEEGVACVLPIVLGVVCQYIYTHYVNIELHLKRTKYVSIGTIVAALINVSLNSYYIPRYGFVVAAYTTLASYFILMIGHFLITHIVLKVKLYDDSFMFASMAITTALGIIIGQTYQAKLLRTGLILAGFFSFVILYHEYILAFAKKMCKRGEYIMRREQSAKSRTGRKKH